MAGRWTVVGVSTTVNALAWGTRSTFALFYVAMLEEFAWGRGPTALGYSLSWLGFVFFAPLAGWLSDRWGTRMVVTGGGVILGAALALTGQVTSLAQYYLCFGLLGGAGIAGMLIPSTTIVTRWFVRSRGTAMGVLSTGPGSAVVFYPLNAWLIEMLGWRMALVSFGGIVATATVLLTLLYREPPPPHRPAGGADLHLLRGARGPRGSVDASARAAERPALGGLRHDRARGHRLPDHGHAPGGPRGGPGRAAGHGGLALRPGRRVHDGGQSCSAAGSRTEWAAEWVFVAGTVVAIVGILSSPSCAAPRTACSSFCTWFPRSASACGSPSSPRFPPTCSPDRTWAPSSGWSGRGRPGRRHRPLPRRLALRRHPELPAGVPGRLCRGRGLGRRGMVRGAAHGRRAEAPGDRRVAFPGWLPHHGRKCYIKGP